MPEETKASLLSAEVQAGLARLDALDAVSLEKSMPVSEEKDDKEVAEKAAAPEVEADKAMCDDDMEKALKDYEDECDKAMPDNLKAFAAKKRAPKGGASEVEKAMPAMPDFKALLTEFGNSLKAEIAAETKSALEPIKASVEAVSALSEKSLLAASVAGDKVSEALSEVKALGDVAAPRQSVTVSSEKSFGLRSAPSFEPVIKWLNENITDPVRRVDARRSLEKSGTSALKDLTFTHGLPQSVALECLVEIGA